MNIFSRSVLLFISMLGMLLLHYAFRYSIASVFLAPVGISALLATIAPAPILPYIIVVFIFEIFSSLPPGSMLLICAIPLIVKFFARIHEPDLSWKFFLFILLVVFLQIASMLIIRNLFIPFAWAHIPFPQSIAQLIVTSIGTYAIAIALHEYISRT